MFISSTYQTAVRAAVVDILSKIRTARLVNQSLNSGEAYFSSAQLRRPVSLLPSGQWSLYLPGKSGYDVN
jgi:hypothetical protein